MKGLFVKDFKLIMTQKKFLLLIILISVGRIVFTDDAGFPVGLLTFVMSLFSLSTISYDEFDNGYAFLFTFPITRTGYVIEKYCLGLLLGCGAWIISVAMAAAAASARGGIALSDLMADNFMILLMLFVLLSVMIPFRIKYGAENGRIAIIASIGLVALLGIILVKGVQILFHIDLLAIINSLPAVSMGILAAASFVTAVVLLLISLKISVVIMNKKEM